MWWLLKGYCQRKCNSSLNTTLQGHYEAQSWNHSKIVAHRFCLQDYLVSRCLSWFERLQIWLCNDAKLFNVAQLLNFCIGCSRHRNGGVIFHIGCSFEHCTTVVLQQLFHEMHCGRLLTYLSWLFLLTRVCGLFFWEFHYRMPISLFWTLTLQNFIFMIDCSQ